MVSHDKMSQLPMSILVTSDDNMKNYNGKIVIAVPTSRLSPSSQTTLQQVLRNNRRNISISKNDTKKEQLWNELTALMNDHANDPPCAVTYCNLNTRIRLV